MQCPLRWRGFTSAPTGVGVAREARPLIPGRQLTMTRSTDKAAACHASYLRLFDFETLFKMLNDSGERWSSSRREQPLHATELECLPAKDATHVGSGVGWWCTTLVNLPLFWITPWGSNVLQKDPPTPNESILVVNVTDQLWCFTFTAYIVYTDIYMGGYQEGYWTKVTYVLLKTAIWTFILLVKPHGNSVTLLIGSFMVFKTKPHP